MTAKFLCRSKPMLCQSKPSWFLWRWRPFLSLYLFLLLGKQACIKMEGVALKSSVLCDPPGYTLCVWYAKGQVCPTGRRNIQRLQMALNLLHITQPPCWGPGSRYSCWDKFIHNCMGSCLIEPHYFNFLLTLCTLWGTAQACVRGRGLSSCCYLCGSSRGWVITVP